VEDMYYVGYFKLDKLLVENCMLYVIHDKYIHTDTDFAAA